MLFLEWQVIGICSEKTLNRDICAWVASGWVGVVVYHPYELGAAVLEDAQNFFLRFELDLNGLMLPEFVRHPMELEASLKNRNKFWNNCRL